MKKIFRFVVQLFRFFADAYRQLKPCGFGIGMALLAFFVFVYFDQGAEVLRALAERRANSRGEYLTGATGVLRLLAFGGGTLLWCLASWYTARVLLYVNLPTTEDLFVQQDDNWPSAHLWLARNVPRILGAAPVAIIGYSMLRATQTYETDPPRLLHVLGVGFLIGSAVLWWALYKRREILEEHARNRLESILARKEKAASNQSAATHLGDVRLMAFDQELLNRASKIRFSG